MIRAWHLDLMMIRQRMLLNLPISLVLCLWLGLQTQSLATVVAAALFMTYPMVGMQLGQYDELKGWKSYRMTLPLSRRDIVAGRYLTLLTLVIASLLTAAVAVGLNIGIAAVAPGLGGPAWMMAAMFSADAVHEALLVGSAFLLVCTVMVCAMTILFYRFGATTATTMLPMLGVFAVLMVALFVGSRDESVVAAWSDGLLWLLSPERLALCCGICAALTVAIMAASAAICMRLYADGTVTRTSSRICPPRRRGYRPVGANASRYAAMSRSRPIAAFAGLVDGNPTCGTESPARSSNGVHNRRYSCVALAPVVATNAMREPRISGTGSFGTALAIDASEAPSISHSAMTSHSAMPCRNANARRESGVSPGASSGSVGSANTAAITGQNRLRGCM